MLISAGKFTREIDTGIIQVDNTYFDVAKLIVNTYIY